MKKQSQAVPHIWTNLPSSVNTKWTLYMEYYFVILKKGDVICGVSVLCVYVHVPSPHCTDVNNRPITDVTMMANQHYVYSSLEYT